LILNVKNPGQRSDSFYSRGVGEPRGVGTVAVVRAAFMGVLVSVAVWGRAATRGRGGADVSLCIAVRAGLRSTYA
jgi:hypothetical protein